jgi:hypothetical protein
MPPEADEVIPAVAAIWPKVVSRHRTEKTYAQRGLTATSVALQGAQIGTGTGTLALALGAAGAASATGIGLVAVAGAATVTSMALGIKSAVSTSHVLDQLLEIQKLGKEHCHRLEDDPKNNLHEWVRVIVLPWIIHQKRHKLAKKIVTSVPTGGLVTGLWSGARNLYKRATGTLGEKRHWYAESLAVHFLTAECLLCMRIISALYSLEEMLWMKQQDSTTITPLLEDKMKSV